MCWPDGGLSWKEISVFKFTGDWLANEISENRLSSNEVAEGFSTWLAP